MILHHKSDHFQNCNNDTSAKLNKWFIVKKFILNFDKTNYIKFTTDDKTYITLIEVIIIKTDEAVITWAANSYFNVIPLASEYLFS
jgi:hypothetical protein